ncbi:hypothetical protein NX059_012267 [Plenodomus lindquistii]|nr:hypothetical protein NX059_012267 [Plenodomus lindquistii]
MVKRDHSPASSTSSGLSNINPEWTRQSRSAPCPAHRPPNTTPPTSLDDRAVVFSEMTEIEQTVNVYKEFSLPAAADRSPDPA